MIRFTCRLRDESGIEGGYRMDVDTEADFYHWLGVYLRTTHKDYTLVEGSVINQGNPIKLVPVDSLLLAFIGRGDLLSPADRRSYGA